MTYDCPNCTFTTSSAVAMHDHFDSEHRGQHCPERPLTSAEIGGCICYAGGSEGIKPGCGYHAAAKRQPWNHRIPWNCPTYWDGCNCPGGPYFVDET